MPLKIEYIQPESLAENAGLLPGDLIITINGKLINDFLDLQFYAADQDLEIVYLRGDSQNKIKLTQNWELPLGIEPENIKCRLCANDCIFCFVEQMRPDVRHSLYIKDDDYRLSFVFGNFITMTNLAERDFRKIIEQKLSPLYVSVHATNPVLRQKMLRHKHDFNIIEVLRKLSLEDIEFHTQIVLVPGWNDGEELLRSLTELSDPNLNVLSIGVVPIGLTKYRDNLTPIRNVNSSEAKETIRIAKNFPKVLCSDEFFLLAGEDVPDAEYYGDYDQLENGIGMVRLFKENWLDNKEEYLDYIKQIKEKMVFICGELSFDFISQLAEEINSEIPNKIRVQKVKNKFLGPTVTVTGLLSARDILEQTNLADDELPVLSRGMFNDDFLTIDNLKLADLATKFGKRILLIDEEFADWFDNEEV